MIPYNKPSNFEIKPLRLTASFVVALSMTASCITLAYGSYGGHGHNSHHGKSSGSIAGRVWDDLNSNGVRESNEPGRAGVTVKLLDKYHNPVKKAMWKPLSKK